MVFIRKIRDYYVLAHNVRKNGKVSQKTKYLGKILPPKARLGQLEKEFLKEIKGKRYKYLTNEDIEQIEAKKLKYSAELKRLSSSEKEKKLENFMVRYTYDSSKLAGVDVTLRQTRLILKDGIIPKGFKDLGVVKALENHEKGVIAITQYKGKLDISFIKKIHRILLSGIDDSIAGKIRSEIKRNVEIAGTTYVPPKWQDVDKEMDSFFRWYSSENRKLHPLELAALIHLRLISLQLFVDGNSRLSRLLMNWILWKKGYPMIDIPATDLENYYDVLDNYQIEKKEKPFINYISKKYLTA